MENRPQSIAEYLNLIIGAAEGGDQSALYRIGQYAVKALNKVDEKPGARWVKASERLPQSNESLFVKIEGKKSVASWNPFHQMFIDDAGDFHPADQVEWWDESPATGREEEWVDVNDRLPYKDGDSSVYCLVNDTYEGIVVRPFNEAHVCWDQEDGDDYYTDAKGGKITHWRPLPEPPKRKQQKEK